MPFPSFFVAYHYSHFNDTCGGFCIHSNSPNPIPQLSAPDLMK